MPSESAIGQLGKLTGSELEPPARTQRIKIASPPPGIKFLGIHDVHQHSGWNNRDQASGELERYRPTQPG